MSWTYISYEQEKRIEAICSEHYTAPGYHDEDCPTCSIRETCRMELSDGETQEAAVERSKIFEIAMAVVIGRM